MFGNKELEKTKRLLSNAIDAHAGEILSLDPAIRKLKIIALEKQQKVLNKDIGKAYPEFTNEERECGFVLGEVLKKVKKHLLEERYEGEFYLETLGGLPADSDFSTYSKRLSQVREDFPIPEKYIDE